MATRCWINQDIPGSTWSWKHSIACERSVQCDTKVQTITVKRAYIYVVHNQKCLLLSKRACVELGLVRWTDKDVEEVNTGPLDFEAEFPALFRRLGKLRTERHITLHPEAKPFCLYNPRKIPHPLIAKVKSQIETMLQQGVILPVTVPTERCAGIVSVLRPNGSVHICVDLTHLNKAVQHEIHPMPSVDENLAKLGDKKIFSKLNANSGFWQIPLDDKLKLLTTFVTPFGCYCFNRLPFGISSAQRSPNALKGHSVRRITSSFMGWASRNMMNTYKLFFTTYKLGWTFMTNMSFHDLQFDSWLTSLIALDSTQTHRRPLLWPNSQSLQMSPGYSDSWGW